MPLPQIDRAFVPLSDLMAKVGYLLFHWSTLEQALTEAILQARAAVGEPKSRVVGTFVERLEMWCEVAKRLSGNDIDAPLYSHICDQALSLRRIRNNIVHGLMAGSSMPHVGPANIVCALGGHDNPTGDTVSYSIDDLEHFVQATDACRRAFRDVEAFNYILDSRFDL